MAKIVLDRVSKVFGSDVIAVNNVSLDIGDGEFMVLVGPSGCGKSTILRILAGLEEVTAGEVFIGDTQVTDLPPKERDVAMVFQNYALYPHMTVEQNLGFGLRLRKMPKDELKRRVQDVANILGLDPLMQRKPGELSGGQRQRVAMGRAMVREPRAFLMDEPLSNLDAKLRVQMRAQLSLLHERLATTTVYVTHDQVEAMTLGATRGRAEGRHPATGGHAAEPLHASREPVRRGVHRFAADEPRRGDGLGGSHLVRGVRHGAPRGTRPARVSRQDGDPRHPALRPRGPRRLAQRDPADDQRDGRGDRGAGFRGQRDLHDRRTTGAHRRHDQGLVGRGRRGEHVADGG